VGVVTDWTRAVEALLPPAAEASAGDEPRPSRVRRALVQPALQLDLRTGDPDRPPLLRARPVVPRGSGGWQVTGASWAALGYAQRGDVPGTRRQRQLLSELVALTRTDHWFSPSASWLDLSDVDSRRVWDLLCELRDCGLPFVTTLRPAVEAVVHDPLEAHLDVRAAADGLDVTCHLLAGPEPAAEPPGHAVALADEAALAWWVDGPRPVLHVAPVPAALSPHLAAVRAFQPVRVPAADADRFVAGYLPRLPGAVAVRLAPDVPRSRHRTVLRVTVTGLDDFSLDLRWSWERTPAGTRDVRAERGLVDAVRAAVPGGVLPAGARPGDVPSFTGLPSPARLAGEAAARCVEVALPALRALHDVAVEVVGELPRYREATEAPVLAFEALRPTDRDWYDLSVSVHVEGEAVPFVTLFTALVKGRSSLLLPSGLRVPLRDGRFAELIELIEESRGIAETPEHTLRLSRFDAAAWDTLDRLGAVEGRAREWRERARAVVQALPAAGERPSREAPAGLTATLRPYQLAGFGWLATLYEQGLGGVLADDMGLGKTLQTLALVQHAREQGLTRAPFLVVAPTSVVSTWQQEAARFTPGLRVVPVPGTTRTRGGATIEQLAAGADVVVTSYALFRLEHRRYREVSWAGLVLDEAQNVKNHASAGYRCARDLGAPWTLAVTGTPMENSLLELWSIMSLVAPGLLPTNPEIFDDVYRFPIERARDGARLAALRRRIAPLLLRRTKEQVAPELPAKTEQVLAVDLAPAHRRAYDALLARERSKVLSLVEDLPENRFRIFRSLTLMRQAALDMSLVDPDHDPGRDLEPGDVPATKLDVLVDLVADVAAEGHRVLVFSQFTRFLRSARQRLAVAGIDTCYLDGSTRRRADVVEEFRTGSAPVFLISLKAGGTGLTLTEADYCIVLDPWWNPASESQAVDRAHRIGQGRPVVVYRLVARDTIEEKVMELKAAKAGLFTSTFDGLELPAAGLTPDDVRHLVG
jgi:hypothetical protein